MRLGRSLVSLILGSCLVSCGSLEGDYVECVAKTPEDSFCSANYDPVCDEYGNTHPNSCEACRTVVFYVPGECEA
jgi:hypothetical protein